ncbi:dehydrin Xero 1 [Ricinus communis]|uniref:dehydrin Xero 1 n=1 Tax=Ricinus communis TaxID=3988 RepID=UPI00201B2CD9|nr:dehydrin Xero 1 [Ricinus communis]
MEHYQNQYGAVPYTDEYGNPMHHNGAAGTYTGALEAGAGFGVGHHKEHHGITGKLHRSGSLSSSSSSEDEGHGGRRKKGLMEKIKEKLPGHKEDRSQVTSTTTPGGYNSTGEHHHGKRGIIDKIKEKFTGGHHHHNEPRHSEHQNY